MNSMNRRQLMRSGLLPLLPGVLPAGLQAAVDPQADRDEPLHRLLAAWRVPGVQGDRIGILEADWAAARIRIAVEQPVPSRAHGLQVLADGGFVAVANRPGRWLLRADAQGQVQRRLEVDDERPLRTFNGHVQPGVDGRWLFTTETDPADGSGWVSVRDARTLARVAQFATAGIDPHQVLQAADGRLLVANGGIPRDRAGRRIEPERMAPSLVRLDPADGALLGRWTLADARLSIRHLAWGTGPDPLLGVALQAEHDDAGDRQAAPVLALWDGESLRLQRTSLAGGYAGDVAAGPGGGFVVSAQKAGRGLWWHPQADDGLVRVAELTEPCALASWQGGSGVLIAAARGVARWHVQHPARMLAWPQAMVPDNHWVLLPPA